MVQFTGEAFTAGVEELERNGVKLRVYGVAKMAVAAVLLLGDRKWHTFLDPVAPPQKHLRVKKKPEGFAPFRLRRWSRQQESNLHLALRRHSFYPLNYGEHEGALFLRFCRFSTDSHLWYHSISRDSESRSDTE